jgi:hypothetical protein
MFVEVPLPVWNTSTMNSPSSAPSMTSGEVLVEQAQLAVDQGRLLLDEPDGADETAGEAQIADRKVDLRAHGVGAVVGVCRDLELTHGVAFGPGRGRGHALVSSRCSGMVMSNSAPLPGMLRAATVPPCRSATVRTI